MANDAQVQNEAGNSFSLNAVFNKAVDNLPFIGGVGFGAGVTTVLYHPTTTGKLFGAAMAGIGVANYVVSKFLLGK